MAAKDWGESPFSDYYLRREITVGSYQSNNKTSVESAIMYL